jgi:hypothetical protein
MPSHCSFSLTVLAVAATPTAAWAKLGFELAVASIFKKDFFFLVLIHISLGTLVNVFFVFRLPSMLFLIRKFIGDLHLHLFEWSLERVVVVVFVDRR